MNTVSSPPGSRQIGPHSRAIRRGVIGDAIDGRSKEGKFLRRVEAELTAQIGGNPSFTQTLLIRRATRAMLQLELLDQKMSGGTWTEFDARTQGGLNNTVRLCVKELGLKPVEPTKPNPLVEHFSRPVQRRSAP